MLTVVRRKGFGYRSFLPLSLASGSWRRRPYGSMHETERPSEEKRRRRLLHAAGVGPGEKLGSGILQH
jgi:hypothetical protein